MIGGGYGTRMVGCRLKTYALLCRGGQCDSGAGGSTDYTLGNVHLHTQRGGYTTVTDRDERERVGDERIQRRCKPHEVCSPLEPLAMEGAVIRGS